MIWKGYKRLICVATLILMSLCSAISQRNLEDLNFRNPVDIPMVLSGNFGELRSNHFHTGIDIKTNGKIGFPVYAIADGWVRRVKSGPFSYGKVLYVDHPTGHTSVYAHLSEYNDTISSFLRLAQKTLLKNEIDVFPNVNRLPVKRGELIGFTGNTGRSGGPHLHFEVRTSDTEKPLNPLLLGFYVKDDIVPSVNGIIVENFADSLRGKVCGQKRYYTIGSPAKKTISDVVLLSENCGISVHALDYLSNSSNKCGIYSMEMYVDDQLHFQMKLDSLDFNTGRYINAHKNYELFKKEKSSFHRCFILPNNKLSIYNDSLNGLLTFSDDEVHDVFISVKDASGNETTLTFKVKKQKGKYDAVVSSIHKYLRYDEANSLEHAHCTFRIPPNRLINDELVSIEELQNKTNSYGGFYKVGDELIPLQNLCLLSIKIQNNDDLDSTKFFISRYDPKKGRYYAQGGEYKNGWIRTRVKQFGIYTVSYDDQNPRVEWNVNAKNIRSNGKIRIKISDDNSGIVTYRLQINGEWIALYYNYKSARLEGKLEEELLLEEILDYRLEVRDERNNITLQEGQL